MSIKYNDKTNNREVLLAGVSPVDQILNGTSKNAIANKAVFNALKEKIDKTVSDLVNYYSKSDVYNKAEVRALISTISTMDIQVVNALPTEDISTTTIYFLKPAGATTYDEYVYINNAWVKIGTTDLDLSQYVTNDALTLKLADYYTKAEITTLLTDYAQKADVYDKDAVDDLLDAKQNTLTFDSTPTASSSNPVTSDGIKDAIDDTAADIYEVIGKRGAKNLITLPYLKTSATHRGVTFTARSDGTITFSGTPDNTLCPLIGTNERIYFPAGTYIVSDGGYPNGGVGLYFFDDEAQTINYSGTYEGLKVAGDGYVYIWTTKTGISNWTSSDTFGYEKTFTLGSPAYVRVQGRSANSNIGQAISGTIYPMIRLASDTDSTYQPYAETNYQLTQDKMSYADNSILGAKNLLHYPYVQTTQTKYGVTFTDNGDGTLTISGTQDGSSSRPYYGCGQWWLTDKTASNYFLKSGSSIIASISTSNDNIGIRVFAFNVSGSTLHDKAVYGSQELTVGPFSTDAYVAVCIETKANSSTIDNVTVYPMLRLASDTDSTYQPYAMTNKELTSLLTTNNAFIVPVVLGNTFSMMETPYRCNHVKLETLGVLGNAAVYISSVTLNVYNQTFIYTETQSLVNLLAADSHYTGLTKEVLVAEGGLHAYLSIVD